jgi:hypothetical protein
MMTKCDASLIVDSKIGRDAWCVFEHQAVLKQGDPPEVILVGAAKLTDVFRLIDGRCNSEWVAIFGNGGQVLVHIIALGINQAEARKYAAEHMRSLRPMPRCNLTGYSLRHNIRAIYCVNNEKTYQSQTEAANDLAIHASSISRHLRGDVAHAQGFKFVYAADVKDGALPEGIGGGS